MQQNLHLFDVTGELCVKKLSLSECVLDAVLFAVRVHLMLMNRDRNMSVQ